jgi:hypothetical protein
VRYQAALRPGKKEPQVSGAGCQKSDQWSPLYLTPERRYLMAELSR